MRTERIELHAQQIRFTASVEDLANRALPKGKPGRPRDPNSVRARRAQKRIARMSRLAERWRKNNP